MLFVVFSRKIAMSKLMTKISMNIRCDNTKMMCILNDDKQSYQFYRLKLSVEKFQDFIKARQRMGECV